MKLYIIVILLAAVIVFALNCLVMPVWLCLGLVAAATVGTIALHGIGSGLTYALRKLINPNAKYFVVSAKEKRFWECLGVRKFKDLLPDLGGIVGFSKAKLVAPKDPEYVEKYLYETCIGEIGHILGALLGYLLLLCMPMKNYWLYIALPGAVVNTFLAILLIIALRYNRHKLAILHKFLTRKKEGGTAE